MKIKRISTPTDGIHLLQHQRFTDDRGYFQESFQKQELNTVLQKEFNFVQDNLVFSKQNVLRGLHYQYQHPQSKLITVVAGEIWDVVVDLRYSSKTFGQSFAFHLKAEQAQSLLIEKGFAHGYLVKSEQTWVLYKTDEFYYPEDEICLKWDDPQIAIPWPIQNRPILSNKDQMGLPFEQLSYFI